MTATVEAYGSLPNFGSRSDTDRPAPADCGPRPLVLFGHGGTTRGLRFGADSTWRVARRMCLNQLGLVCVRAPVARTDNRE